MSDSLNATEIAVGSLLSRNGNGAWSNGEYGGYGPFASPSSNAVRIDRNADVASERSQGTRAILEHDFTAVRDQFNTVNRAGEFNRVLAEMHDMNVHASDQRFQSELRTNDRLRDLQAEMNENARKAADCCCELRAQVVENKSDLLAAIAASESRGIERQLNAANAKITQLETVNALSKCFCPPPCPEK